MNLTPPIFIGTFRHSDELVLQEIIKKSLDCGIYGFDTSPSYNTEVSLSKILNSELSCRKIKREDIWISDKIDWWQMYNTNGVISKYVEIALQKMGINYLDILHIHWPFPQYLKKTWITFKELKDSGLVKNISLSNVRVRHIKELIDSTSIKPDFIQIECHPLRTCKEELTYCKSHDIKVQAYSPVCQMRNEIKEDIGISEISKNHNKTINQIILKWHIQNGIIPIFMTSKIHRVQENCDIFNFNLTKNEMEYIDSLNQNYKIFVESICCPGC
ncbi:MAG: aldo/keto reductase [Muribaculaceae bacterium]|nr:aldo/keto reductase [Muribaculaceae bacterium]